MTEPTSPPAPDRRTPSLVEASIPLIALALCLGVGTAYLKFPAEPMLLCGTVVAALIGWRLGYSWKEMEGGIIRTLSTGMPAILILIMVGALISSWMAAGVIPMLISYGLDLLSPRFFLVSACVLCSVVSILIGSSWGTVGTVGVALMGVAGGLGVEAAPAAGAIVSGAYFGDKLSPFSDTTNLAPIVARSNLIDHIKWMIWTTGPAWLLGLGVFLVAGWGLAGGDPSDVIAIQDGIRGAYRFSPLLLLPPVIIVGFAVRQAPILPGMLVGTAVAVALAVLLQDRAFGDLMSAIVVGETPPGVPDLERLLSTDGMMGIMRTTLLIFCAFSFAGIMRLCGLLDRILAAMLKVVKGTFGLVASTVASGILTAVVTGSSYLSIIVPGDLFSDPFRKAGLAAKNLSRTLEDSGTVVVPLVPWSAAGAFMAGTLGVATVEYAPWAIMNYTGFMFALVLGATGLGIAPRTRDDETEPGS